MTTLDGLTISTGKLDDEGVLCILVRLEGGETQEFVLTELQTVALIKALSEQLVVNYKGEEE